MIDLIRVDGVLATMYLIIQLDLLAGHKLRIVHYAKLRLSRVGSGRMTKRQKRPTFENCGTFLFPICYPHFVIGILH